METHAHGQVQWQPRRASVAATKVLEVGALAGMGSGFIMAAWQMVVAAIAQDPTAAHGIHQTLWTPPEGIARVAVLVVSSLWSAAQLTGDLIHAGPETSSASDLLEAGSVVWLSTVIAFALLYRQLDDGGPAARAHHLRAHPDRAFPSS